MVNGWSIAAVLNLRVILLKETLGNIWRHVWLSQSGGVCASSEPASKIPTTHTRQPPRAKNYPAQSATSAELKKP